MIPRLPVLQPLPPIYESFLAAVRGAGFSGDVSTTHADTTVNSTDNSIYQLPPRAVLCPRTVGDVAIVARLAAEPRFAQVKVAPRGGGTGTNAQALTDGLVVDLSRHLNQILEINVEERWARVQAGVVKDQLGAAVAPHGLFFAPELSTSNRATLGGMVNTDASGQGSCIYGKTRDHVLELTSVFLGGDVWSSSKVSPEGLSRIRARGDRVGALHAKVDDLARENASLIAERFPKLNRCVTGYDLAHVRDEQGRFDLNSVLCGAEGTLGFVVEAKLNLLPIPSHAVLVCLRYGSFDGALRDAPSLMAFGATSIETVDGTVLGLARGDVIWHKVREFFPDDAEGPAQAVNLIEFVGHAEAEVDGPLAKLLAALAGEGPLRGRRGHTVARGPGIAAVWGMRKKGVGILGNLPGERRPVPFVEDTAVPTARLADYIQELRALLDGLGLRYGMFGHVDAGVLHVRPALDMKDPAQERLVRTITDAVAGLTQKYDGLLWGEHGKGVRSEYAPAFFGPLYPVLQELKEAFDPRHQLNPGKIAAPRGEALVQIDALPTRGQGDRTIPAAAREEYEGAMRCNGNGACYTFDADAAMCPSWKVTRERRHSPKGRAELLREWLRLGGGVGAGVGVGVGGWWRGLVDFVPRLFHTVAAAFGRPDFSHEVKEAMDGCLSCKACAGECPIKVDIPEMRARFLAAYHGRYLRPPRDYLVGLIEQVMPLFARLPWLYTLATGTGPGRAFARVFGLTALPGLSPIDARRELASRGVVEATPALLRALPVDERARSVVVVQDAFTRYFDTQVLLDLVDLAAALGHRVWVAPLLPNGKALHIHGFLGGFRRAAARNARMLHGLAEQGVPLVGLDPAMTLTYRDEYPEELGEAAVPRVLLVQEWLADREAPALSQATAAGQAPARLFPHCTERTNAAGSLAQWQKAFQRAGLAVQVEQTGCCGMAGTWGHLASHRADSERLFAMSWSGKVAPGVAGGEPLVTGYSCRSQAKLVEGLRLRHPVSALLDRVRSGAATRS